MNRLQQDKKMSDLRRSYEKMMLKVIASKYDLETLALDDNEKGMLKSKIQHQQWAADEILKRIKYNANKFRKQEASK